MLLSIHVTVHRDKFLFNKQPDALIIQIYSVIKSTCFGHLLCSSSGDVYCSFGTGTFHAGFWWRLTKQSQDGTIRPERSGQLHPSKPFSHTSPYSTRM